VRIAYLANYQGPDLIAQRGIRRNLALAGSRKIGAIASLLGELGHKVVVFSRGCPAENSGRYYQSYNSVTTEGLGVVRVVYAPCWDLSYPGAVAGIWFFRRALIREFSRQPFDMIFTYNISHTETTAALWAARRGVPVVVEYEDDAFVNRGGVVDWMAHSRGRMATKLRPFVKGLLAVSPELRAQFNNHNAALLRGIVDDDLVGIPSGGGFAGGALKVLYAGTMDRSKGLEALLEGWRGALEGAELHLVGDGPLRVELERSFKTANVFFHGFVARAKLVELIGESHVCVNPHGPSLKAGNLSPFKIIEYIGAGKPVVSTRMGALEPEIAQAILFAEDATPEGLRTAIRIMARELSVYQEKAVLARKAVVATYGREGVKRKLKAVLEGAVVSKRPNGREGPL